MANFWRRWWAWIWSWGFFSNLRKDIQVILDRDPAARSWLEVIICYPGLHANFLHRRAHWLWNHGFPLTARLVSNFSRWLTGLEIHPGAKLGQGVFFDHGMGIVIGETSEIGDGCTIYHGVTLGGTTSHTGARRHPALGSEVVVGAGANVLGGFRVGDGAKIGSNAVVIKEVPAGATAVGNPARVLGANSESKTPKPLSEFTAYGDTTGHDPVTFALQSLLNHSADQEHQIVMLWRALGDLAAQKALRDCIPQEALVTEGQLKKQELQDLIGFDSWCPDI